MYVYIIFIIYIEWMRKRTYRLGLPIGPALPAAGRGLVVEVALRAALGLLRLRLRVTRSRQSDQGQHVYTCG